MNYATAPGPGDRETWGTYSDPAASTREDLIEAFVDRETEKGGEFYPLAVENLADALGWIGREELAVIASMLEAKNYAAAGMIIQAYAERYWRSYAEEEAKRLVDGMMARPRRFETEDV